MNCRALKIQTPVRTVLDVGSIFGTVQEGLSACSTATSRGAAAVRRAPSVGLLTLDAVPKTGSGLVSATPEYEITDEELRERFAMRNHEIVSGAVQPESILRA